MPRGFGLKHSQHQTTHQATNSSSFGKDLAQANFGSQTVKQSISCLFALTSLEGAINHKPMASAEYINDMNEMRSHSGDAADDWIAAIHDI